VTRPHRDAGGGAPAQGGFDVFSNRIGTRKAIYDLRTHGRLYAMSPSLASAEECPICHNPVPADAFECPMCGERLRVPAAESEEADPMEDHGPRFREKFLYYAGIALILLGGPGIALGSWLHDVLRISYLNYNAFDAFGSVNRLVLGLGLIVMIVGVVFLILSLRLSRPADAEAAG
jgi:hypothetical protein